MAMTRTHVAHGVEAQLCSESAWISSQFSGLPQGFVETRGFPRVFVGISRGRRWTQNVGTRGVASWTCVEACRGHQWAWVVDTDGSMSWKRVDSRRGLAWSRVVGRDGLVSWTQLDGCRGQEWAGIVGRDG